MGYLYGSKDGIEGHGLSEDETLMCLYPRASAGTHWRVLRVHPTEERKNKSPPGEDFSNVVALSTHIILQSVGTNHNLSSDQALRMTTYGNEWRVFGTSTTLPANAVSLWSFVDTQWAEEVVAEARRNPKGQEDPGELLQNPVYRAEHELRVLESEGGAAVYKVLERIYPIIRGAGMHVVRRLRCMCVNADTDGRGTLPLHTFRGILSWIAIRLNDDEMDQLIALFELGPGSRIIDYRRFFTLMAPSMPNLRKDVVRDAYSKLQSMARGGLVQVEDIQRNWNPKCHPEVQKGVITESEARQDFILQWDVTSADGLVSYEEFLEYYSDVSTAVESNEHFVELVRCGWRL